MHAADKSPDRFVDNAADQLRHDLKTPLAAIYGQAQLLTRAIRRAPTLSDKDRTRLLAGGTAIERAVREIVVAIDGIGSSSSDGSPESTKMKQ
jgi:signal transduction histidine kinase